jgi:predicted Zn finger-like uncharacterized protein
MIITCEKCGTRFNLDESLLDAEGSTVRCGRCRNIFTAFPPPPDLEFDDLDFSDTEFEKETDLSEAGFQDTNEPETLKLETTDPDELELETTDPDEIEIEIEAADLPGEDEPDLSAKPDLAEELALPEEPGLPEDEGGDLICPLMMKKQRLKMMKMNFKGWMNLMIQRLLLTNRPTIRLRPAARPGHL